uniref:Chromo domain-containing protein n=1 Tax=Ditylenchus dipsaci TaxID=166011 RepID=A0A915DE86_9BILA
MVVITLNLEARIRPASMDESHLEEQEDEEYYNYEVEKIVKWQWNKQTQTNQYLIKWLNYGSQFNNWVDECDLNCSELLENFNKKDGAKFAREEKIRKKMAEQRTPIIDTQQEQEEPDDAGFILDMDLIPYKIVEKDEENGFDRGWEAEKVLTLTCSSSSSATTPDSAIVKFKGFKYSQLISLEQLKKYAPEELSAYLSDRLREQLAKKCGTSKA